MRISATKRAAAAAARRLYAVKAGRSDAWPMNARVIVPGYVSHRRLPPPLTCLSTPADLAAAAAVVRDVSSGAALPVPPAASRNISRPEPSAGLRQSSLSSRSGGRSRVDFRWKLEHVAYSSGDVAGRLGATLIRRIIVRQETAIVAVLTSSLASVSFPRKSQITVSRLTDQATLCCYSVLMMILIMIIADNSSCSNCNNSLTLFQTYSNGMKGFVMSSVYFCYIGKKT